ncbi:hypothetical protein BC827DRAFT_1228816 [Russula dissimulans]|nr:hypothetical protein BC827DRAFT_1228816 [Russula dissimulans]
MSLAKTTLFAIRPQVAHLSRVQCRSASSDSHSHDEHHGVENTPYAKEGFSSAGWTYTIIAALGVVGFYKFAPSPGEDNYLTHYIAHYFTPSSSWAAANDRHLELTTNLQEAVQISQSGQRPHIHRYRYPQCVDSRILSYSAC